MITLELYWNDLTKEAQQKILDIAGENCNYDVFPFCTLEFQNDEIDLYDLESEPIGNRF